MLPMPNRAAFAVLAVMLPFVAGIAVDRSALAQGAPPQSQPPKPGHPPQSSKPPQASQAPQPNQRAALPKTPAEREKTLSDLYAILAAADDEDSAKAIAEAIERVWLHSGSPTVDVLMERAMKAVADKKLDLAMKLLDHVVVLAPDFTEAWNRRAYVYFVKNDVDHALGDLRRALALDPNHFKALDGLAQILREIGQKKPALKAFRQLLEVHPYWSGAKQAVEELERDVDGQGI
jgi:tetratricopeptide (TPR) repeat protein